MDHPHFTSRCALRLAAVLVSALALSACSSLHQGSSYEAPTSRTMGGAEANRPGLGTSAGYETWSRVHRSQLYRQSSSPNAVDSFHYNDEAGAKAMADILGGGARRSGLLEAADGRLKAGLVDAGGSAFPYLETKSRRIVMGKAGSNYQVRLQNRTDHRLEVVVSVDSINVLTGTTASYSQRGFIVEPHKSIDIDGFRISDTSARHFQFGSVAESKAAHKGQARNVGIIGLAVFEEDAAKAKMELQREQLQRDDANAFLPVSS